MPVDKARLSPEIQLLYGPDAEASGLVHALSGTSAVLKRVEQPADVNGADAALLLLDAGLLATGSVSNWREALRGAGAECLVLAEAGIAAEPGVDLALPAGLSHRDSLNIIRLALNRWILERENRQLKTILDKTEEDLKLLTEIGIALSAEKDLDRLLDKILSEAQFLACCDAASLYLVERPEGELPVLVFKLTRNDTIPVDFQEQQMVLDHRSIAGYVAVTDSELNIPNAYELPDNAPYSFNPDFDRSKGYRTVSLLALPLRNYRGEVIGVLQFINRKRRRDVLLDSEEVALRETRPFSEEQIRILRALASQSAVAIENGVLLENINNLFSGFVQASVNAIEQRDPTTSGHSFRVADLTTELATRLSSARLPGYRDVTFNEEQLKELRYASLLHDFGKVGVREHVLTKAKKLPEGRFGLVRYRVRLQQEKLRRQLAEQLLAAAKNGADPAQVAALEEKARQELARMEAYLAAIEQANEPTLLEEGNFAHLQEIRQYRFEAPDEEVEFLLSQEEFDRLSIRRGSLSPEERKEIESHVVHTANFLRLIPWTPELARIPEIAESHHEKLDGSGYPNGIGAGQIPVGSKIMAICDIYDAVTASDRPYKAAAPRDVAYDILQQEAGAGKLDSSLVQLFIEADVYKCLEGKDYRSEGLVASTSNHPCDPGVHGE